MVVQHNMQAMNANRQLGITTTQQGKSTEKLSTGYKINRAADDAAGLSISEKMRRQIRGLDRASTNAQDGVSSIQTAEGALNEVHDMLQRMNELANQAANGTNSANDRQSIQDEISQLNTEIDRVAETTKFNETYLLKGDAGTKQIALNGHDAGLKGTLADHGETATFEIDIKSDTDISISSHTFHIYEDKDKIETLQGQIDDADAVMINGTTYKRKVSDGDVTGDISASVAALKTCAAALQNKAASQTTAAATKSGSVAVKKASAASKSGSAQKKQASADKLAASAQKLSATATSLEAKAACLEGAAATMSASADAMTASAKSFSDQASAKEAAATVLEAQGGDATSIATLKTCAAALKSKAASQTTKAATKSGSAAIKSASAATKAGSAATRKGSADLKSASAQKLSAQATSLGAMAASLEGAAATMEGSAKAMEASAQSFTDQADAKEQAIKDLKKAAAGVTDSTELTKFIADGLESGDVGREYLASEIKAMIVDGAQITIDSGNGFEKSRTAVDTINNKNNLKIDDVKTLVKDALLQANQIGADDESSVSVEESSQQGDTYTFTINKGHVEVARAKNFELQVGADADLTNKIAVNIETMNSKYLGVQNLNVVDDSGVAATYAIDAIEDAISKVSAQRSELGAAQNRLEHTINNLDNVVENTQSAESSIRDTDIADEMVRYSKNNILSQAGQSMLAQANQSTQGALSLLG